MSIEYTIDIQLTEMGFPDIVQPSEAPAGETPRRPPLSGDSLAPGRKKKLLLQQAVPARPPGNVEQPARVSSSPLPETSPRKVLGPPCERDVKASAPVEAPEPDGEDQTAGPLTPDPPGPSTDHNYSRDRDAADGDSALRDPGELPEDEDSDDSEVSVACDEEEVDEDEDDEDDGELNGESGHSGDYRCTVCDLQLPSRFKLQDHMNLHTGSHPYCCAECGKRFCQFNNYRLHLRTHAKYQLANFQCRICLHCFASKEALNQHLSRTHLEEEFYECDLCKRVFTSLKACENHVETHKNMLGVNCQLCGRNFAAQKSLTRHLKGSCRSTPSYRCTDCTKIFMRKNALLKHSFSHLGLLPYTCVRCRCHFRLAKLYRQHKCEPERLHCVACLREFPSQRDFEQHKKDTGCWGSQEPKGDEIRCLECGQRFDSTEELKKHAGAHQRVLNCAECGKGFRSALLLMSHMGGHAGKSPCLCQSCGVGFPHQQNYDSHLKTCGQTPQPAIAPKKRQPPKSLAPVTKRPTPKPDSQRPPPSPDPKRPAPVRDASSPGPVTERVSPGPRPSNGLWKLRLDKEPPPGVNLVLFLPVCPTQTNGLTLPSIVSTTLPGPAIQVEPQQHERSAAFEAQQKAPLDLVTRFKQDPQCEAVLDLSRKCNSSKFSLSDIPPLPIKSETEEFEISADGTDGESKAGVKTNPGETDTFTQGKEFKTDPMDLSFPCVKITSSGLKVDIKNEPQSAGPAIDSWPSSYGQPAEKKIKMEVDV